MFSNLWLLYRSKSFLCGYSYRIRIATFYGRRDLECGEGSLEPNASLLYPKCQSLPRRFWNGVEQLQGLPFNPERGTPQRASPKMEHMVPSPHSLLLYGLSLRGQPGSVTKAMSIKRLRAHYCMGSITGCCSWAGPEDRMRGSKWVWRHLTGKVRNKSLAWAAKGPGTKRPACTYQGAEWHLLQGGRPAAGIEGSPGQQFCEVATVWDGEQGRMIWSPGSKNAVPQKWAGGAQCCVWPLVSLFQFMSQLGLIVMLVRVPAYLSWVRGPSEGASKGMQGQQPGGQCRGVSGKQRESLRGKEGSG